ncbi:MAG TPA: cytochrome c maturation protein CcmE [Devosiaceae bacterium]|nr:cytochrome c maturation protein CcmE [Devosiaceae bacterium]
MNRKQKRLSVIAGLAVVVAVATTLILVALQDQIVFFYSPSDLQERAVAAGTPIRLGGLVKEGSIVQQGEINDFIVTDGGAEMPVRYVGILPDLFRDGQGVVAEGAIGGNGVFTASNVLAKHDENYMPKEVVEALKERGEWQRGDGS